MRDQTKNSRGVPGSRVSDRAAAYLWVRNVRLCAAQEKVTFSSSLIKRSLCAGRGEELSLFILFSWTNISRNQTRTHMVDRTVVCQDRAAVYHGSFVPQGEIGGCVRRRNSFVLYLAN